MPKIKRPQLKSLVWLAFYFFLFCLLLQHGFGYLDFDFGWHLKFGQHIVIGQQAPHQQIYMWSLGNQTWVDHEWLSNALIYLIYNYGGYFSLQIIFALIIVMAMALLAWYAKKVYLKQKGDYALMTLQTLGVLAMLPHLGIRVQEITILFLVLLLIILDNWQRTNSRWLLALPLLFCLWANLHAGFLIGLAVLAWWLIVQLVLRLFKKLAKLKNPSWLSKQSASQQQFLAVFLISIISALATLLTPYGLELYSFLSGYSQTAYMTAIAEWQSLYYWPIKYWQLLFLGLTISLVITHYYFTSKSATRFLGLWPLSLSIIFAILAVKSIRHFPLFMAVASLTLWPPLIQQQLTGFKYLKINLYSRLIQAAWLIAFLLLGLVYLTQTAFIGQPFNDYCQVHPCGAVQYLRQHPEYQQLKIFNHYNFGGYFIWQLPQTRLFIDGRLPQYQFANHSLLEEYLEFSQPEKTADKLADYNIAMVIWREKLLSYQPNFLDKIFLGQQINAAQKQTDALKDYLDSSPDWQKVFNDQVGAIYLNKNVD